MVDMDAKLAGKLRSLWRVYRKKIVALSNPASTIRAAAVSSRFLVFIFYDLPLNCQIELISKETLKQILHLIFDLVLQQFLMISSGFSILVHKHTGEQKITDSNCPKDSKAKF